MIEIVAEALVIQATERAGGVGGAWAAMIDVRRNCGLSTQDFDAAVLRLAIKGTVVPSPEDNQKALDQADHEAAVVRGFGEPQHLITVC